MIKVLYNELSFASKLILGVRAGVFFMAFLLLAAIMIPVAVVMALCNCKRGIYSYIFAYIVINCLCRYILNIKFEFINTSILPARFILAPKHQSAIDSLLFFNCPEIKNLAIVLKQELLAIPFGAFLARKGLFIIINRQDKRNSLSKLLDGIENLNNEVAITPLIFPEGTRTEAIIQEQEKKVKYKKGVYYIHEKTGLPVVPVALNTGVYWSRRSFLKYPGTIKIVFCPPIETDPNMASKDFMRQLEETIEQETSALVKSAVEDSLSKT